MTVPDMAARSPAVGIKSGTLPGRAVVVGVDFGTLSGRAVVVRVTDGAELGSAVHEYSLSGLIVGLTLATKPEDIYRALLEATAFGTRLIIETLEANGVPVLEQVAAGGLLKNRFLMQLYADVTRHPLSLLRSAQGSALGAAIHGAVAAGAYPDIFAAAAAMGHKQSAAYTPDAGRAAAYDALYAEYRRLHDYFGRGANEVMYRLREIKRAASSAGSAGRTA